jgi:MFS family permease
LIVFASLLAGAGSLVYVTAHTVYWLYLATPLFGLAIGAGMTAAYTAAAEVIPANARGVGFGLLTTASLVGLAVSPIVAGFLGAWSIRSVFALDAASLAALGFGVSLASRAMRGELPLPDSQFPN